MRSRSGIVVVVVLAAAGCASNAGSQPTPVGTAFASVSVTENGKPHQLVPGTTISLRFTDDGRLAASAGCNSMGGRVTLTGGTLDAADLTSTEMGCDTARDQQDSWLATLLRSKPSWRLTADRLMLTSAGTEVVLTAEKPAPLTGTAWTVDTLIDGRSAARGGTIETLVFGDGTATISGGCLSGTVGYTVTGSTIRFDKPMTTIAPCTFEGAKVVSAVLGVMPGDVTYKIDGKSLTLTAADGTGLGLRG